ncbi:molecular chaperone DnaK, partial [Candidatus Berkelbacteria bacterium]|nr:molecular chaperone DnaK [Candidatus Berkelbacteria bacterium]
RSLVAMMEGNQPKVIPSAEGSPLIPSVVAMAKNNERLVGQLAKRQAVTNPEQTVYSVKRLIGRRFSDAEVKKTMTMVPYPVIEKDHQIRVAMGDKDYSPQEISAMILGKIKQDAEAFLGTKITQAVITVPAYFNDAQRQATKDAGTIAGLEVARIINEPTAAALAYGLDKKKEGKIAVYDFGGGTFDITVLELGEGVFEVKATGGDTHLGGDDLDQQIMEWILKEFQKDQGVTLKNDPMALQRIKEAAEKAKVELSSAQETELNLPFITADATGPKHLVMKLTRAKLEQLTGELIDRTIPIVEQVLKDAKVSAKEIDDVVLVGGQTRMPYLQEAVRKFFGKESNKGINPDEVVALGAAIQGGVLAGEVKDVLLLDVTPLTVGIETLGGVLTPLIERNTTIPTSRSETFSTAADNQTQVEIHVLQGERTMAADNRTLGRFALDGIPPAPRGIPQVEVTFDIDANGILHVAAKDKATGREQKITITSSSGLSKDEVEQLRQDAETHAEGDQKKRELIETRNMADSLIYTSEKTLKDAGEKVSQDDRRTVEDAILKLKTSLTNDDPATMRTAAEELSQAIQKVGAAMYSSTATSEPAQTDEPPATTDETDTPPADDKGKN